MVLKVKMIPGIFLIMIIAQHAKGDNNATFFRREKVYISSHDIGNITVKSEIECNVKCLNDGDCYAVSCQCVQMDAVGNGMCYLKSKENETHKYAYEGDDNMCFAIKQSESEDVTTTASTQQSTSVIDMVECVLNQCTGHSQYDIAVVTTEAIYFYDHFSVLPNLPCKTVTDVKSFFSGFADLPPVKDWEGILSYQWTYIDLFSKGRVWRWQSTGGGIAVVAGYPISYTSYINQVYGFTPLNVPATLEWAVYRSKTGGTDIHMYNGVQFYFFSNQQPFMDVFLPNATVVNQNGDLVSPWTQLMDNVVAAASIDNMGEDYVLVTSDGSIYNYDVHYSGVLSHYTVTYHHIGYLQL